MKYYIWAVVCVALGAISALILRDFHYFVYENSFNIFELLYFVLTAAIAIFVTGKLDEAIQMKRSQKDIIIHKIEEVDGEIKDIYKLFSYDTDKKKYNTNNTILLSSIKSIALWAKRYEKIIKEYYPEIESKYSKINTRKLVSVCTRLPKSGEAQDISCVDGVWTYSDNKYTQIQTEIENLRNICFVNIILLNKE